MRDRGNLSLLLVKCNVYGKGLDNILEIFELFFIEEFVGDTRWQNSLSKHGEGNGHTKIFVAGLETSDGG